MCSTINKPLTSVEISNGIRLIMKVNPDLTVKKISKAIGYSESYIYRLLKLTKEP